MTDQFHRNVDGMGADEMQTPELKLIQNIGGDDAKAAGARPGDFYFPLTGEIVAGDKGINFVLADVIKTRTYWGRSELGNEPPECSSANAATNRSQDNKDCNVCAHKTDAPWAIPTAERRAYCTPSYVLFCIRA